MQKIEYILRNNLDIQYFELKNQSAHHSGHAHRMANLDLSKEAETHFDLLLVSSSFYGKTRLQRQRTINDLLKSEWSDGLHALSIKALTPSEFKDK